MYAVIDLETTGRRTSWHDRAVESGRRAGKRTGPVWSCMSHRFPSDVDHALHCGTSRVPPGAANCSHRAYDGEGIR